MRPRFATSLASLSDRDLFKRLAEGLSLLAEHVASVEADVQHLVATGHPRGAAILREVAEEEAAKFLILVDVARCPRKNQRLKSDQLDRFDEHLAKGIYAEVCWTSPADFAETRRYVDMVRKSHYLDGPNDVDWIFRNQIEDYREGHLYVDFVGRDDGGGEWVSPAHWDRVGITHSSAVVQLVGAMEKAGFATDEGLQIVADIWRDVQIEDSTRWSKVASLNRKTLEALRQAGLWQPETAEGDFGRVLEAWPFPLISLDLKALPVDLDDLREKQRNFPAPL